jgi:CheY-like chemotaxis protein/HPt (histidine-containing phosphotransfer) domain-containing protein
MDRHGRKLLIIEDDPIIANLYRNKFEKEGYQVEIAPDGQTGFYRLHEARFDVLLLDLMLPQMNGLDILKKIRAQKRFENFPVFVFTNAYLGNIAQEAARAGANHVFFKATTSPRQIIDAINSALMLTPAAPEQQQIPNTPTTSQPQQSFTVQPPVQPQIPAQPPPAVPLPQQTPVSQFPAAFPPAAPAQQQYQQPYPAPIQTTPPISPVTSAPVQQPIPPTPPPIPAISPGALPPGTPQPAPASSTQDSDAQFQAEIRQTMLASGPETVSTLRKILQNIVQSKDEARLASLNELSRKVHSLTGSAGLAGLKTMGQIGSAFEALLKELYMTPSNINASTLHTIAQIIDFINVLFSKGIAADTMEAKPVNILVVDDEIISRRAVTYALEKVGLKSVAMDDPLTAFKLLQENPFDLVITDIDMPNMDGFELCSKLRSIPEHKNTPVIFVTSLNAFENRAKSVLSGGNDLIAKPFILIELGVKALILVLSKRLAKTEQPKTETKTA